MFNNRRSVIYLPLAFALVLIVGFFLGATIVKVSTIDKGILKEMQSRNYNPVDYVIDYIRQEYVDSVKVSDLQESAIEGILSSLDPHSQYISAAEFNDVNDQLLGNFEGIGVQFRLEEDTVYIINTIPGGPSEKVGIMAGDRIVNVDGEVIAGVKASNNDIMKKLKGERGTKVKVGILRRGVEGLLDFEITRDVIPTYSIDVSFIPEPGIGYIKLSKFSATTSEELSQALISLKQQGMQSLVLDLRGNAGGYLQTAITVSDQFLPDGKLIVYTKGLNRPKQIANASVEGLFEKGTLILLIDEGSASSSEIVAGAIQDNDRGVIIGRRSFGKGLVQEQLSLPDGAALRLTVARYYTPTGRSIQKPYENGHADEYNSEVYERMVHGEMEDVDSIKFVDSLKYTTPAGRMVYGGGGIMPDIFVTVERDPNYRYYNELLNKGVFYQFAFHYTDFHRTELKSYKGIADFDARFVITPAMLREFIVFAESKGVKHDVAGMAFVKNELENLLKALIARNIYDEKGFYPIYLRTDKVYLKALDEIRHRTIVVDKIYQP